jgi:PAS domain S-box-containing protein
VSAAAHGEYLDRTARPSGRSVPHVLLVDDQPARLLTYETMLEGLEIICVKASSGAEALQLVLTQSFAVIVLDVSMPQMDGFETARIIRGHPRFEQTPIIFVTGVNVDELDALRAYEAGAIDYISVPIVPAILRSKIALLTELYLRRADLERLNWELEVTRARLQEETDHSLALSRARLQESQQRYRAVFDMPTQYTVVAEAIRDASGRIIDWCCSDVNANGSRLVQRSREDLIGKRLSDVLPDRAERLTAVWSEVMNQGAMHSYEARMNDIDFLVHVFALDADTVVCSALDISARIAAEQEAKRLSRMDRAEKEWLAAVLHSITDEVYFADTGLRYTYGNSAAVRALGRTPDGVLVEEVGERLQICRPDGTRLPVEESPSARALRGETVRAQEQRVRLRADGEWSYRQVSSAPVRDKAGAVIGAVCVIRDVTEQRRSQEALALSEQRLREADQRKDEFIAMLAHELRNPLVPIRTGIELLKRADEHPQAIREIGPMMERQMVHITRLIDDLLDVSRITSGKIELKRRPVTLCSLVSGAVDAARTQIQEGRLDLQTEISDSESMLDVDPTRVTQIISNLLHNAAKFTPAGGRIRLWAGIERREQNDMAEAIIRVSDDGIGISSTMLTRVFELFAQAETAPDGKESGLGIGLAIAQKLAQLHGGTIAVRSDGPGRGSEFTIHLPIAAKIVASRVKAEQSRASLAHVRVLVVDDNHDAADVIAVLLRASEMEVRVAYSGQSALAMFEEFRPSIAVLDIGMTGMDGYETCRRIRAKYGYSSRLVAASGWGQERDKHLAHEAGFDIHLTKPIESDALLETIRQLCEEGPPAAAGTSNDRSALGR